MLSVSEVEQLRSNGVRSLSPGDFRALCDMALECANEYQANEGIIASLGAIDEVGEQKTCDTETTNEATDE